MKAKRAYRMKNRRLRYSITVAGKIDRETFEQLKYSSGKMRLSHSEYLRRAIGAYLNANLLPS